MKTKILFGALSSAVFSFASANETTLPEVVVTATRVSQPLATTLSASTVLTEQEIQESGVFDLPSLLQRVAGLDISQMGGIGKQSSLFIRGSNSQHVLVLVDGVRLGSATTGLTAIQDIMLDQVARIEVVRGNVSSVYGAQAIGGVVQIFTKQGQQGNKLNFSANLASHATERLSTGFTGGDDKNRASVQLSQLASDGFSAMDFSKNPLANPDKDAYHNLAMSANWQHDFSDKHNIAVNLLNAQADNQYDSGFDAVADERNQQRLTSLSLSSNHQLSDTWFSRVQLAQSVDAYESSSDGVNLADYQTRNRQLNWQNEIQFGKQNTLLLGLDLLRQKVSASTDFSQSSRRVNSVYAGYTGQYQALQVQLNGRYDDNSQFGSKSTGLFGLAYHMSPNWRLAGSYSTAFNAPTFNDLYWPLDWGFQGNPNLKPEHSRHYELALSYQQPNQSATLRYFDNRIRDLIANTADWSTMQNLNQAQIDGYEFEYHAQYGQTQVGANLTLQDPRDTNTGARLLRRSKELANINLQHQLGAWGLRADLQHRGNAKDSGGDLKAFNTLNLGVNYAVNQQLKLSAKIDNVTDSDNSTAYGYNSAGRVWMLGVNYQQ